MASQKFITELLLAWGRGDPTALDALIPLIYDELRRIAESYLRDERPNHTLQPTALVHEAYIRLIDTRYIQWQNRAHFFGAAAQAMRRILVDHARRHHAEKRGGDVQRVTLDEESAGVAGKDVNLLALDEALEKLSEVDPQRCRVVELRFFSGLSNREAAEVMQLPETTVASQWRTAKAWLHRELVGEHRP
jgi:RNA polymerase sigma factor (TIGR02999 family)